LFRSAAFAKENHPLAVTRHPVSLPLPNRRFN
jgi:hypothetical protein